ncbi:MAG: zinc transporter ZupT [Anaerolineae bacterium]|nr:zinc transporter ZupT [Anaerolineae bacterium]
MLRTRPSGAHASTAVGSLIAIRAKRTDFRFLSIATGFSAGVMLYVAFVEIFFKGQEALVLRYGETLGGWINVISFFGGILFIGLIDNLIPSQENPHEVHTETETLPLASDSPDAQTAGIEDYTAQHKRLMRMGIFSALAIGIHNFPEGLATFLSGLQDPSLGMAIAIAVALHNVPEGISVSVPVFYATGSRRKAFTLSALSGLAEPIGALIAVFVLILIFGTGGAVVPPELMGILFGAVAGIMVYISLDELLPTSRAYGKGHDSLLGLIGGMGVMALSLLLI